MSCPHGLPELNCPICSISEKMRPPFRIGELKHREIPLEVPFKEEIEKKKGSQVTPLFEVENWSLRMPNRPQRIYDLAKHTFSNSYPSNPLMEERIKLLEKIHGKSEKEAQQIREQALINVKKFFLEN